MGQGKLSTYAMNVLCAVLVVYAGVTIAQYVLRGTLHWEDVALQAALWALFFHLHGRAKAGAFAEDALVLAAKGDAEELRIRYRDIISAVPAGADAAMRRDAVRAYSLLDRGMLCCITYREKGRERAVLVKEPAGFWDTLAEKCPGAVHTEVDDFLERQMKRKRGGVK